MKRVALLLLLMGCASAPRLSTPSGKPEVNIYGISTHAILNDIATWSSRRGYEIGVRTDTSLSTFVENTVLVDSWQTKNQPTKDTYIVPTVNIFTIRRAGDTATIYLAQFETRKRQSSGVYTGESPIVTKELTSGSALEMMQQDLEELGRFISLRKL
jgi:hypothetical protein